MIVTLLDRIMEVLLWLIPTLGYALIIFSVWRRKALISMAIDVLE